MLTVLWLHVGGLPIFALAQGYPLLHSVAECSALAAAALVAGSPRFGRTVRSAAVAVGLLTASALLVHFSGGYIEFHFHFFVVIALIALYQHWLPFLLAIGYVVVHHGLAGAIDPDLVYNHPDAIADPWKWAAIHGVFVLAASAASVFTWGIAETERLRRRDLETVTEAALARLPLVELQEEILGRVSRIVNADAAALSLIEGDRLIVRAAHGRPPKAEDVSLAALADELEGQVLARGDAVVRSDGETGAAAAVPLLVEGTVIGVLHVTSIHPAGFGDEQLRMLQLVADRVAPSIDRARLYEREHRIAETLQRSLLPNLRPATPGLDVAARYCPADPGTQVGGDWYDVLPLGDGKVAVAIGDVVGHGIDAAALMGQMRTGLRAYAAEDAPPSVIVEKLSALLQDLDDDQIATMVYVELVPDSGEFRYVSAGHLPPLVRGPATEAVFLEDGRTAPLGIRERAPIVEGHGVLAPGGALLLYTDGLIERRGESLDDALAALSDLVSAARFKEAEELSEIVLEQQRFPTPGDDDLALIVVRREVPVGKTLAMTFPAAPDAVRDVRQAMEQWLAESGATAAEAVDIVLATNEASVDAIERASEDEPSTFCVEARRSATAVEITVRDSGRWRSVNRDGRRAMGFRIIDRLVDDLVTEVSGRGTTVRLRKRIDAREDAAGYTTDASASSASSREA